MGFNIGTSKRNVFCWFLFWIFVALGTYGTLVEPNLVEIHHLWIEDSGAGEALKGKVAVHLSDLHIGKFGSHEKKILGILEEIDPDMIFLTGDFVKWQGHYQGALTFFSRLKAKIGIWAVMGDYDYSNSRKSCIFCHEQGSGRPTQEHSVHFLKDSAENICLQERDVLIGGIDGSEEVDPNGINSTIMLSHSPLSFDDLDDNRDILVLAGDTHGGQVPIPSWLWKFLGYDKCARYNQGFFKKGKKKMFVSRGIGTSHFPLRIFRRPEVVVLHF